MKGLSSAGNKRQNLRSGDNDLVVALPAAKYGPERCEYNLKPRNPRVFKFGFLLSQWEGHPLTK
ncbi:hypothetical protein FC99_GL001963 [Levilactobacillus koreensis JCM 16448]|nr:hypothetical protein FC99_GL001963 [Levilactobacillus koreensis JCM 16448]